MRETTVPKSFAAQRTNPKMLPGAKLRMRWRRSTICSATSRPNRIQCSICFSSQINSTWVSVSLIDARRDHGAPLVGVFPVPAVANYRRVRFR